MIAQSRNALFHIVSLTFLLGSATQRIATAQAAAPPKTIDDASFKQYAKTPSLVLSLNLIKLTPSVLDTDKALMISFIRLNNCHNPAIENLLNNEFDYPDVAAFYKKHATQILAAAPTTMTVPIHIDLGQYDATTSSFPFHAHDLPQAESTIRSSRQNQQEGLSFDHLDFSTLFWLNAQVSTPPCGFVFNGLHTRRPTSVFDIAFPPIVLDGIPMDMASAKRYVQSLPDSTSRPMDVVFQIEILQQPPRIVDNTGAPAAIAFSGKAIGITAMSKYPDGQVLATINPQALAAPSQSPTASAVEEAPLSGVGTAQPSSSPNPIAPSPSTQPHSESEVRLFQQYSTGCEGGDAKGCVMVAYSYLHGRGVDKDPQLAKQFYDKACSMGSQQGCRESKWVKAQ